MVDVEFPDLPKIRCTKIDKSIDEFEGATEELTN